MAKRRLKKKVRLSLIFLFIILLSILFIVFFLNNNKDNKNKEDNKEVVESTPTPTELYTKEEKEKLKKLNNVHEQIDYFKMDNLDRYIMYKNNNPTLTDIDVVTRVNIGLDNKYYTNTVDSPYKNTNYILSNKYYSLGNYVPDNLENISSIFATSGRMLVHEARLAFENLATSALNEGFNIRAMSAYRSYNYQVGLYNRYVQADGVEMADTYSARPGFSEHQTGLVVDVDNKKITYTSFENTPEYTWMKNNAYKFGFIERYPKGKENITGYSYESWHYRYVGVDIATYIQENNITFDEYYVRFIENKK